MPWSSGTFSRTDGTRNGSTVWTQAKAASVKILASDHDTHDQDLATGINNALNKNGENSPTANVNWGGFKITNLANGTASGDALHYGQIGTQIQAYNANLASLAGQTLAADKGLYATGAATLAQYDLTAAGRALLDDADNTAQRATLGLGTAAVANTGVSNGNVPAMDGTGYPAANGSQITNLDADNLASGTVPAARIAFAAQSDQETGTSTTLPVTPGVQQFHPSALKSWAEWNGNGTVALLASWNTSGITDNGTGLYTPAWDVDYSSANYGISGICKPNGVSNAGVMLNNGGTLTAGAAQVSTQTFGGTDHDAARVSVMAAGDQ